MAYYCLHKFHWSPSEFISMPLPEKAFITAAVKMKVKQEEDEAKRLKAKSGKGKKRR